MPLEKHAPSIASDMASERIRRRPLPAKVRRRILLHKTILHLSVLASLLLLIQSGIFLGASKEPGGQQLTNKASKSEGATLEGQEEMLSENPISQPTLRLVKYFEGYNPTCVDWLDGHATIGYGNLLHFGPCTAADNALHVSEEEAEATLSDDLLFFKEKVNQFVGVAINKDIEAALISFAYNVGDVGLRDSTLLSLLNAKEYRAAAEQFDLWISGPSGPLPGLVKRRNMEKDLFLQGVSRLNHE